MCLVLSAISQFTCVCLFVCLFLFICGKMLSMAFSPCLALSYVHLPGRRPDSSCPAWQHWACLPFCVTSGFRLYKECCKPVPIKIDVAAKCSNIVALWKSFVLRSWVLGYLHLLDMSLSTPALVDGRLHPPHWRDQVCYTAHASPS